MFSQTCSGVQVSTPRLQSSISGRGGGGGGGGGGSILLVQWIVARKLSKQYVRTFISPDKYILLHDWEGSIQFQDGGFGPTVGRDYT